MLPNLPSHGIFKSGAKVVIFFEGKAKDSEKKLFFFEVSAGRKMSEVVPDY
jgi:hypothetical protein